MQNYTSISKEYTVRMDKYGFRIWIETKYTVRMDKYGF